MFRRILPNRLLRALVLFCTCSALLTATGEAAAPVIQVDLTPGHATNHFSPLRALGAGVDAQNAGAVNLIYTPANISQMLASGVGPVSYRLYTELGVQAWHWNPQGTWSDPMGQGYFTGSTNSAGDINHSYGYRLPHRGFTHDQANDDDYSRLDDGNPATYWKSNPYLTSAFTGEADALHPQWIVIDLGQAEPVNAVQLDRANPYATAYQVQYWTGGDAIYDPANGQWNTFPSGAVTAGSGGNVTQRLAANPISVEYIRVLLTGSSNTCDTHGAGDPRDCVGYAINEVGIGTLNAHGALNDRMTHSPDTTQTLTYASSVDPWHSAANTVTDEEQAGLDLVFKSGLTRGLPTMVPVSLLYGTPDDAAAELRYLQARGYPISYVELGEEPDGQYALPEDYGALYVQWATALHAVDPTLKLGGPVFQGTNGDVPAWPDATGNTSWLTRFLNYLSAHNRLGDLAFMSFEHYPFACNSGWKSLYQEPGIVKNVMQAWKNDGLPSNVPVFITESNFSADTTANFQQLLGALWHADFVGSFLTAGGSGAFYYEYEPTPLTSSGAPCNQYSAYGMFAVSNQYKIRYRTSQFFSMQLLTQQWAQPVDATHDVYPATSGIVDAHGNVLVTAYVLKRPDGQWSLLLINKDQNAAHRLTVNFHNANDNSDHSFTGKVTMIKFGKAQYAWHAKGANGYPSPDGPPATTSVNGGAGVIYTLPAASIVVLRGTVQ